MQKEIHVSISGSYTSGNKILAASSLVTFPGTFVFSPLSMKLVGIIKILITN